MDQLAQAIGATGADDLAATLSELVERLGLPSRLATLGVEQSDIEAVARLSQALQPAISWDEDTVAEVLSAAL
jgi:alcohol dehydrogenase class IV